MNMTSNSFEKREYKNLSTLEKVAQWAIPILVIIIGVIATLFLFVFKQPCGIDKEFISCQLHPFTVWDFVGVVMFYFGVLFLSTIPQKLLILLAGMDDDQDTGTTMKWVAAICLLGFFLIYV